MVDFLNIALALKLDAITINPYVQQDVLDINWMDSERDEYHISVRLTTAEEGAIVLAMRTEMGEI